MAATKVKKAKKLYAVYNPAGELAGEPQPTRTMAWGSAALCGSISLTDSIRALRRRGWARSAVVVEQIVTRVPPGARRPTPS